MSKIVAVHVGERKNPFSLLQQVDEAWFSDKMKQIFGKKEEPAKQQADEPAERATPSVHDSSALATIASEILDVPAGESRVVLFMSHGQLKSYYLVSGGGQRLIDALDNKTIAKMVGKPQLAESAYKVGDLIKEIAGDQSSEVDSSEKIAQDPSEKTAQHDKAAQQATPAPKSKVELVLLGTDFGYNDVVTPPSGVGTLDRAVLINAPADLVKQIKDAASIEEARTALKKLMSHKIYVMTLNLTNANAGNLVPDMTMAQTIDEKAKLLNPNIIENYPMNTRWAAAKKEWQAGSPEAQDEKRVNALADKAARVTREKEALKTLGTSSDEEDFVLKAFVNADSPEKVAAVLQGAIGSKVSLDALEQILNNFEQTKKALKVREVIDLLKPVTSKKQYQKLKGKHARRPK